MNDEALWNSTQVAKYFNLSRSWVEHAAADGRIPSVLIGRARRYVPAEIRALPKPAPTRGKAITISTTRRPRES